MPFTREDKLIIKHYRLQKKYSARKLLKEFPDRNWTRSGLDYLLTKIDQTQTIERQSGTGRPKRLRMVIKVNEMHIKQFT